ncbi:MAG: 30S ribosomal protein S8 [Nanobdellota archaeon]
MAMNNPLAAVLSHVLNCERVGKREVLVRPASKMIKKVLEIFKDQHMIGESELVDEARGGTLKVNLLGNINKCGVITPRFSVRKNNFENYEKKYLPSKDFGVLVVLTSKGVMTHKEAKEKEVGGRLLAYCY